MPDIVPRRAVRGRLYQDHIAKAWPDLYTHGIEQSLIGVGVSETGSLCLRHGSNYATHVLHEKIQQNTLHQHWYKLNSPGVREALRSAKMSWIGLLYFIRSMLDVLPFEVVDVIMSDVQRQHHDDQDGLCECF